MNFVYIQMQCWLPFGFLQTSIDSITISTLTQECPFDFTATTLKAVINEADFIQSTGQYELSFITKFQQSQNFSDLKTNLTWAIYTTAQLFADSDLIVEMTLIYIGYLFYAAVVILVALILWCIYGCSQKCKTKKLEKHKQLAVESLKNLPRQKKTNRYDIEQVRYTEPRRDYEQRYRDSVPYQVQHYPQQRKEMIW